MGDFNHDHVQWKSLESAGGDDHQFLLLTQDCFLTQLVLEPTRGGNVLGLGRNTCQKRLLEKLLTNRYCGGI